MKLLQMPHRSEAAAKDPGTPQSGLLSQVWATDGSLARTVSLLQAEAKQETATEEAEREERERSTPVFRVVLAPQTPFYRSYTEAMLRRYGVLSSESGRVPSLLGREMFRGNVTHYRVHGFDDVVIFVHDVEQCIRLLTPEQQRLILRIAVQEYTVAETAAMQRRSLRSTERHYTEAVDELTAIFLKRRLLERIATDSCQEGENTTRLVSHSAAATYS